MWARPPEVTDDVSVGDEIGYTGAAGQQLQSP
jgi:hypothetical protein